VQRGKKVYSPLKLLQVVKHGYRLFKKKNDPRYNFAIDDPNEKNYTGNEMALKTLQT
jgi:hypothetical protein